MTGKRLLIVEDTASIALLLKANLSQVGLIVETVATAQEALARFDSAASSVTPFDLVVVDMNLPDANGAELLGRLACYKACPPRFVISADGSREMRSRAFTAGADQFFEKPFDVAVLKDRIARQFHDCDTVRRHGDDQQYVEKKQELLEGYQAYLARLAEALAVPLPFKKLRSLLHQVKGSAALYGFEPLSELAKKLSVKLMQEGPKAAEFARLELRVMLKSVSSEKV